MPRARVLDFVVRQTDMRRPLLLSDRLSEDLGIDGDEAVDFFEAFEAEFEADLEPLYRTWSSHFGPEGFPLSMGMMMVAIAVAVGVVATLADLPEWLTIGLGLAAALGWLIGLRAWPLNRGMAWTPVTIGDLVVAAEAGRWPEPPAPPSSASPSPSVRNP